MADPNFMILQETGAKTWSVEEKIDEGIGLFNRIGNAIIENWKLAIIGLVALAVLLRD